ncbi:Os12g0351750 [Oryza sativa Japonica Group]|uniref:Os12g0351750 protein n=2 Tax=Oryza sativa subsp. japonica TaxID=39947 RepID=B9G299_ORYSJ|nr:hypothetical protein OsJ_28496 [Oryza sativa Japonica Group]BAT16819.1 Os12g0351750 [Oryza sativa Japonica Group]
MLSSYVAYLFFHLKTHSQLFEPQEVEGGEGDAGDDEKPALGFASLLFSPAPCSNAALCPVARLQVRRRYCCAITGPP